MARQRMAGERLKQELGHGKQRSGDGSEQNRPHRAALPGIYGPTGAVARPGDGSEQGRPRRVLTR